MGANTRTKYGSQNKYLPAELVEINLALEMIMDWGKYSLTITQGSWSGSVSASAGTHNGADGQDLTPNEEKRKEKYLRILGCMHYIRPPLPGVWPRHSHGGRDYSTGGSRGFMQQLAAYHRRENALANRGRDEGYRMLVFPKHIYRGYKGYVQARKNCSAWEQQTKKSKELTKVKKGHMTYVVAETQVAGKRWYVTITGKCILASEWAKIKAPKGATPRKPNPPQPKPKPTPKPTTPPAPKPPVVKPPVQPKPTPKPPEPIDIVVDLKLGTRNVIFRRYTSTGTNPPFRNVKKGLDYSKRLPLLATDVRAADLDWLGTTEAGTYAASDSLEKAIEKETSTLWNNFLHGDDAGDITQAHLWRDNVLQLIRKGKEKLPKGTSHNWLIWGTYLIKGTDQEITLGVVHGEWHGGGKSAKGNMYDHARRDNVAAAMKFLDTKAGKDGIAVLTGDFNSSLQNPYDGPNVAAKANGWVDAEQVKGISQVNTEYRSYHDQKSLSDIKDDKQIDRFFLREADLKSGKVVAKRIRVLASTATRKGSDHFQVDLLINVKAKKK